jgi:hypothetical protein
MLAVFRLAPGGETAGPITSNGIARIAPDARMKSGNAPGACFGTVGVFRCRGHAIALALVEREALPPPVILI